MNALASHGISSVFHYAPLHYLLFIARSGVLASKSALIECGYTTSHFRSSSRGQDHARGFAHYVHLTVDEHAPILSAKLKRGFPHFTIRIPTNKLDGVSFDLCRYNIAKTRYLRRGDKVGPAANKSNGFYYENMQLPIARSIEQQMPLLDANYRRNMIEVLVADKLAIPLQAEFIFHHLDDLNLASRFFNPKESTWTFALATRYLGYIANPNYSRSVEIFLERAAVENDWKGNGLEFDRV